MFFMICRFSKANTITAHYSYELIKIRGYGMTALDAFYPVVSETKYSSS